MKLGEARETKENVDDVGSKFCTPLPVFSQNSCQRSNDSFFEKIRERKYLLRTTLKLADKNYLDHPQSVDRFAA